MSTPSARDILVGATAQLAEAGVASPRHDAEALAAHVLGVARGRLALVDLAALDNARPAYEALIARRARREPLQHVIGRTGFRRLDLAVGPGALVPRPESELLVEAALAWLRAEGVSAPQIVDLGTGTGALALALADECPASTVWALEREADALAWAERNVDETGLPVRLTAGDMTNVLQVLPQLAGMVDVVISNPPYLPAQLASVLEPEVAKFDPPQALFAGADALAGVKAVELAARQLLRRGGLVVVEHGDDQAVSAPTCFGASWTAVRDHTDLNGLARFLTAVRA